MLFEAQNALQAHTFRLIHIKHRPACEPTGATKPSS
ncbi:hypothetical protein BSS2_I0997 [Brucella suis bv. 1 str. S2]|uniref:Uncharacterized protein n=4 Tax=Brucella TaxID=234 RepID=Q2YQ48_BRUA2|nr:hypothetical protein BR1023 [Brucella suis 1330]AAX74378.1 hypothetical protein BruAb1_1028 [Brucella abortus bv. 1 str. 9-941]ACU48006.1 hypothetical protein BMI_I1026 [Brucella microti CCM 4915]AEK54340.1 hypothetical protein BPI_I1064 [Brucella pinnipedialis B2/94]AEU06031.1 hypothetical protein BSVBI22_A1019 [Brucella suis VBI22]AHN46654.1 hypothetical protein BSS2_I0997 [Brucella suis bv. 1 str. S2]CAJ10998.1 conserved hypothetical protein [Brucella abortus 2308]CDL76420.1 unnamed pr